MIGRLHRAWLVAGVTFLVLLASAAFRSSVGVMVVPLEDEFGWTRSATSLAISVGLVVYGLTAPFAAALMERFGIRRIAVLALLLMAVGTGLTLAMTQSWQLVLLWGVMVGLGTGSTALVFGALVTARWFAHRRGLVLGILGAAWATGQLIFLPFLARTIESQGWRYASAAIAIACLALIPLVWFVIADRPADVGLRPYGASGDLTDAELERNATHSGWRAAGLALATLRAAARTRAFWLLAGTFFICGWTTNGIISSHFVPAMHDHGMAATSAASLLAVVGLFDLIGTLGSGWLSDRIDPRYLLVAYYGLRGMALVALPVFLGPDIDPPLLVVMVLFGLDWVATVPPTALLCTRIFGPERGPIVFGWVFASHMVGAAVAAAVSGTIRDAAGDYASAWYLAGALAVVAAFACLAIPAAREQRVGVDA
ncbi:MAG: MFS transporter [Actinobacteria bacterium]|nr:MFS transporter [Actinomycetota bacterium]